MDFRQTFVIGASWGKDEMIIGFGKNEQRSRSQRDQIMSETIVFAILQYHIMAAEAYSTRRQCRRVQLSRLFIPV